MRLLQGKVIAITGAGAGLGRAYAEYLGGEGARLVVNDVGRTAEGRSSAEQLVAELAAAGVSAVANSESVASFAGAASVVDSAVQAYGRLDVLVNNAGIVRDKMMLDLTESMWDEVLAVHLVGTFACSQAAAEQMKDQPEGGVIINTSSYAGLRGNFGQSNYAAAKGGIYSLTLVHALELSRLGIRVNAIAPLAKTQMTAGFGTVPDSMTAEQVAPMVAFLASDLAAEVNGRVFGVHGELIFEYRMEQSAGLRATRWTPQRIAEQLERIGDFGGTSAPPTEADEAPLVREIFARLPETYRVHRGGSWRAVLRWEVAGADSFVVQIEPESCTVTSVAAGAEEVPPTCVVRTDVTTFLALAEGVLEGEQAYMEGRITATKLRQLLRFQQLVDVVQARRLAAQSD